MMRAAAGRVGVLPVVPRHLQWSPWWYISTCHSLRRFAGNRDAGGESLRGAGRQRVPQTVVLKPQHK